MLKFAANPLGLCYFWPSLSIGCKQLKRTPRHENNCVKPPALDTSEKPQIFKEKMLIQLLKKRDSYGVAGSQGEFIALLRRFANVCCLGKLGYVSNQLVAFR